MVLCITSDKCYENRESLHAYREEDALGGCDPYSSSKAAAELVVAAYRRSYFQSVFIDKQKVGMGNVVTLAGTGNDAKRLERPLGK